MIIAGFRPADDRPVPVADEDACLVLGPPRSGKTSAIVGASLLAHPGPAVVTSSKIDVLLSTVGVRATQGPVWTFDADGYLPVVPHLAILPATWTPVPACIDWDTALLHARAMVGATVKSGQGGGDERFWYDQAARALAAALHAAALAGRTAADVALWILTTDLHTPATILRQHKAGWAAAILDALASSDGRYRDGVIATAGHVLAVYDSARARAMSAKPSFPVEDFLDSAGTLYVISPTERQELFAPLVVGLLDEIRRAAFARAQAGKALHTTLFALDELARIAPVHDLPGWLAEAGSHGVQILGVLQDLGQARERWSPHVASSFTTLFRHKILFPGVLDRETLDAFANLLGEETWGTGTGAVTHRPRWSVSDLASPPAGSLIHIDLAHAQRLRVIRIHDIA